MQISILAALTTSDSSIEVMALLDFFPLYPFIAPKNIAINKNK